MHEGAASVRWGLRGIPAAAEDVMVARDLLLARTHRRALPRGAHLHAQRRRHGGVRRAARACRSPAKPRRTISRSPTPTCAPYDSNYKMKPPLRAPCDREARGRTASRRGAVDAIATDHAPAPRQRKDAGIRALPVRHHRPRNRARRWRWNDLVHTGKISLARMVELFTTGPESVLRLGRGTLARGRARRRHHLQHRRRLDLRREPVLLAQPQLAVPRPHASAAARWRRW